MSVNKIKKNCNICEFIENEHFYNGYHTCVAKYCEIKGDRIRFKRIKALFCKWFTLDSKRRKAIKKYNEIQVI